MTSVEATTRSHVCESCMKEFVSRNQLFLHLKSVGPNHEESEEILHHKSSSSIKTLEDKLRVIADDDWYRIFCKPQGLATMGSKDLTMLKSSKLLLPNAISLNLSYKKAIPCHRLDCATGGIIICSKSKLAERVIMSSFQCRLVHKTYLAIVIGRVETEDGEINSPIGNKQALTRYFVTHYTRSEQYGWVTTLRLHPVTGRKHQLRKHLMRIGHPIIGDKRFTVANMWPQTKIQECNNLFLWAVEIDFPHPKYCEVLAGKMDQQAAGNDDDDDEDCDDVDEIDVFSIPKVHPKTGVAIPEFSADQRVVVAIPEPEYYAAFRKEHELLWQEAQNSSEDHVTETNK